MRSSGVEGVEILQGSSGGQLGYSLKVTFEQDLEKMRAKTCGHLEEKYSRHREQLGLGA